MTLEGFSADTIEKMKRLCDLLSAIQNSEFISKRLSLYGGTALNFIYLNNPRLSEDLDTITDILIKKIGVKSEIE